MYDEDIKESNNQINNHVYHTKNHFVYDLAYIKSNFQKDKKKSFFSLFSSNKNPNILNQWGQLFSTKNIFVGNIC